MKVWFILASLAAVVIWRAYAAGGDRYYVSGEIMPPVQYEDEPSMI